MTEPMPDAADELMDLLRAVREAIGIPRAATTDGERVRAELVTARLIRVGVALRVLDEDPPSIGVATTTRWLREEIAELPATGYVTDEQAQAAVAAGKTWSEAVTLPTATPQTTGGRT